VRSRHRGVVAEKQRFRVKVRDATTLSAMDLDELLVGAQTPVGDRAGADGRRTRLAGQRSPTKRTQQERVVGVGPQVVRVP